MAEPRRPTMQDIAEEAGVGKATVSLALRNDSRLRPETRERIQQIAVRLGYRANPTVANLMAQLRSSQTPKYQATLALINAASDPRTLSSLHTFRDWVGGCSRRAGQLGYQVDEFWLREPGLAPARLVKILESRGIRGLIIGAVLDPDSLGEEFNAVWQHFACAVMGVRPRRPNLHFACNDQYSTSLQCIEEILRRGYKRPGLVISPEVDANVDWRFSAAFWAGQQILPKAERLPVFHFSPGAEQAFQTWVRENRPDSILCIHTEVKDWLEAAGIRVPGEIALAHLDRTDDLTGWAGMRQNNDIVGMAAVDMVVGQLHRNEAGETPFPKCMLIESTWVEGETFPRG